MVNICFGCIMFIPSKFCGKWSVKGWSVYDSKTGFFSKIGVYRGKCMEPEDTGEPLGEQAVFKLFGGLRTKGMLHIMVASFLSLSLYRN